MSEQLCPECECRWCNQKKRFAEFASQHGLHLYPDPSGERYLEPTVRGQGPEPHGCKKGEFVGYMDHLWNALVRESDGDDDLLIPVRR